MKISYTKINIKTLLLHYLKYKNTRSWIIDITSIVLLFLTYYYSPFITIFPCILILLFTLIMIYFGTIEPLYDTWKRWNETYYNNFQIKMKRNNILRTSGKNPKHIYEIIQYHKNGDVKSHKRFGDREPQITYLDPLYKNTLEKKEKRKLEKSKKEDTIKEKITDLEVSENKNNQCICFKDRKSLKFSHLQIYGSFKKEDKDWVVVDITKRKEVVFTSDSHDECKDWKDDELILKGGDKLNGHHKYVHENGEVYEGEWKDGKKNGGGVLISSEHGDRYEGEWKDGKQNGIGTYKDSSGKIISGNWKNGDIEKEDMTYYEEKGKVLIDKKK